MVSLFIPFLRVFIGYLHSLIFQSKLSQADLSGKVNHDVIRSWDPLQLTPLMRLSVVHGHQFCGWREVTTTMTHPHLIIKWNKNLLSPRLFGRSFQEIEDRGRPLDGLNTKFNIHVKRSVILTDLWWEYCQNKSERVLRLNIARKACMKIIVLNLRQKLWFIPWLNHWVLDLT